jgi:hypothetical protein
LRGFGADLVRESKEIHIIQDGQLIAPVEVFEEIKPPGTRAKSPRSRAHFRDSASARERWFIPRKTKRKMGRFDN